MKCSHCNQDLYVSKVVPTSEMNSTDVYMDQTFVCTNPDCEIYCGDDLSNPKHVAMTMKVKVN